MQPVFAFQPSRSIRASKTALISALAVAICAVFFTANFAVLQTYNYSPVAQAASQTETFFAASGQWVLVGITHNMPMPRVGLFHFGELVLASVLIPVVIYISSSTFPGAISAATNINTTGWSTTNKNLWLNVYPLIAIVTAIMIPLTFIILPFAGEASGRSGMI